MLEKELGHYITGDLAHLSSQFSLHFIIFIILSTDRPHHIKSMTTAEHLKNNSVSVTSVQLVAELEKGKFPPDAS